MATYYRNLTDRNTISKVFNLDTIQALKENSFLDFFTEIGKLTEKEEKQQLRHRRNPLFYGLYRDNNKYGTLFA